MQRLISSVNLMKNGMTSYKLVDQLDQNRNLILYWRPVGL